MFSKAKTYADSYFSTASRIEFNTVSLCSLPFFLVFDRVTAYQSSNEQIHKFKINIVIGNTSTNGLIISTEGRSNKIGRPARLRFDLGIFVSELQQAETKVEERFGGYMVYAKTLIRTPKRRRICAGLVYLWPLGFLIWIILGQAQPFLGEFCLYLSSSAEVAVVVIIKIGKNLGVTSETITIIF